MQFYDIWNLQIIDLMLPHTHTGIQIDSHLFEWQMAIQSEQEQRKWSNFGDALTVCTEMYNRRKLQINPPSSKYCLW